MKAISQSKLNNLMQLTAIIISINISFSLLGQPKIGPEDNPFGSNEAKGTNITSFVGTFSSPDGKINVIITTREANWIDVKLNEDGSPLTLVDFKMNDGEGPIFWFAEVRDVILLQFNEFDTSEDGDTEYEISYFDLDYNKAEHWNWDEETELINQIGPSCCSVPSPNIDNLYESVITLKNVDSKK